MNGISDFDAKKTCLVTLSLLPLNTSVISGDFLA